MPGRKEKTMISINAMKNKKINIDDEILHALFQNPIIRDLPDLAELYGLYSTFVVAQRSIYFVYGFNKEIIHHGTFVEWEHTIVSKDIASRMGYMDMEDTAMDLISRDYNVANIESLIDYNGVVWRMMSLEILKCRYEKYGMDMPQFCFWNQENYTELKKFLYVNNNPTIIENAAKSIHRLKEKEFLRDIAIWEWPITPQGRKPGFLAFNVFSRYSGRTSNYKKEMQLFDHPERWEAMFQSHVHDDDVVIINMPEVLGEFIKDGLRNMGIPWKPVPDDKHYLNEKNRETEMINRVLDEEEASEILQQYVKFAVHRLDYGACIYWASQFTKTQFSTEEIEYGRTLYRSTIQNRRIAGERQPDVASYIFFVPHQYWENFKSFAGQKNIKYGYLDVDWLQTAFFDGIYLITEFSNMPLVSHWQHSAMFLQLSTHTGSISGDAAVEYRTRHQNLISVYSSRAPWGYKDGRMNLKVEAVGLGGDDQEYMGQVAAEQLRWVPTCHSLENLKRQHIIADNKG